MTPEIYQQAKELFHEAKGLDVEQRAAFLNENCNGDKELRKQVENLLNSFAKLDGFIEVPAYALMAESLTDDSHTEIKGKVISHYKVISKIGQGGMGAVYLAQRADDVYQKQVAIKIIRHGFVNEDLLERFYNERQILARLDHPNIAKLLDGGATEEGLPYFVMDYVEGLPLLDYCNEKNLSTEERLKLFRTVCSAVGHAHQNLIIHRDLKPSNILVTKEGIPKLLDFGIAKVFQDGEQKETTVTHLHIMTPEYASPEQIIGKHITTSSDIYSLGVILYQLLTGTRPYNFRSHSPQDIAHAICEEEPSRLRIADCGLRNEEKSSLKNLFFYPQFAIRIPHSKDLDNIVLMSLRKEPERRYATVEQFSEDIRRHLEGLPVIARKDTFAYRSSKFVNRNRYAVAAAVVVILLLLAGIAGIIRQGRIAGEERDKAQKEKLKAERINKFFQDMLARANPNWYAPGSGKKQDVTVIEALNEATRKIENELNDEPEIKAEILMTIGDTFGSMQRRDLAERPFELALNLRRSLFGEDHIKVAESYYYLGGAKFLLGKIDESEQLYKKALEIQRKRPNEGNNLPYMLFEYGDLMKLKGEYSAAESNYLEALEIFRRKNGDNHITVGIAHDYLGGLHIERGEIDKAYTEFQTALQIFGNTQNIYAARLNEKVGSIWLLNKNYSEAEASYHKAIDLYSLSYDEKNINIAKVRVQLALINGFNGKGKEAKAIAEKILAEQRKLMPEDSSELATLIGRIGLLMLKNGDPKRAETLFRECLKISMLKSQISSSSLASLKGHIGECLLMQRRYAEAEGLLKEYYNVYKSTQVPDSYYLREATERLKKLYADWGKDEEAAKYKVG